VKQLATVVVAVLTVVAAGLAWWWFRSPAQFDPVQWKAAHQGFCKDERGDMVEDVRGRYLRGGTGQRDVAELLGEPEYVNLERTPARGQVWWSWNVGQDFIDCATLDVLFRNRRLIASEIGHT
jgi:hypothetical protein